MNTALQEVADVNEPHYIDDGEPEAVAPAGAPEPEEKVVVLDGNDDIQVEIADDTPPDDQNRKPLSKEAMADLELEEEAEHYSDNVKKRISKMRKAMHDERREKETAWRERDAATEMAQGAYQQQQNIQGQMTQSQAWAIEQATQRGALAAAIAKQKLSDAIEEGDVDGQTEAQMELGQAQQFQTQVAQMAQRVPQRAPQQQPVAQQQQPVAQQQQQAYAQQQRRTPPVDERAQAWVDKNSEWFGEGKNEQMTDFAKEVHYTLVQNGVSPQTDEYYNRLETRLQEKYPTKFGGKKQPPSTVVAPAGRVPQGKRVVLTRSEVAVAESMGITNEQYARAKLQMENA